MAFPTPSTPIPAYSEIYITASGTSGTGDGSPMVPYVCGTAADLDSIINTYTPANCTINLLPGNYSTHGLLLKDGQNLIGAGRANTTLKLTDGSGGFSYQIAVIRGVGNEISVQNLKVDANSELLLPANRKIYNLINLSGSYCSIRNIHGINPYGDTTLQWPAASPCQSEAYRAAHPGGCPAVPAEGFSIIIEAIAPDGCVDALIEECIVEQIHGNYVNGIGLLNGGSDGLAPINGRITNCVVRDNPWIAYTIWSGVVSECLADGCALFWRHDTSTLIDVSLINNQARNHKGGYFLFYTPNVSLAADNIWGRNLYIQGNLFEYASDLTSALSPIWLDKGPEAPVGVFNRVTITDNVIVLPDTNKDYEIAWINPGYYTDVTFSNNVSNGKAPNLPADWAYASTFVFVDNVYRGDNQGFAPLKKDSLSEYKVWNNWPLSGGSAGIGAYFGTKRGGIDWEVQNGGDTSWAVRSMSGGVLSTPLYGDQSKNVYIPSILKMGAGMAAVQSGAGSPEGAVTAPVGSIYLQTNSSVPALYVKQSGTAATGWDAVQTPAGTVADFAGGTAPDGWLLCYGQPVSRATYSRLFAVINTTYGTGDGSTTFNLPDCRGRVSAGKDNMGGTAAGKLTSSTILPDANSLNGQGGFQTITLDSTQIPAHSHPMVYSQTSYVWALSNNNNATTTGTGLRTTGGNTSTLPPSTGNNTGGGAAHSNVQPTIIFNKIIKV